MAAIGGAAIETSMGLLAFRMEVAGFEPVRVSLSRFGDRLRDFRPFWRHYFAPAFYREVERNFETEGGFVGGWRRLSEPYAQWKARHYPGKPILRRTDALFRSMRYQEGSGTVGPQGIFVAEEQRLVIGTTVKWAGWLQRGTGRMPARPFLFVTANARSTFGRLLHRFVTDMADEAGLKTATARARGVSSGLL